MRLWRMNNNNFLLYTRCMTYNHSSYIVDAMNGFCMQKTTFPFVNVIVDDASTDGEPEVIEQYLQENFNLDDSAVVRREETNDYRLVYAQHKNNKNCYFVVLYLKYNHYLKKDKQHYYAKWLNSSKYVAICEGDDYWTDPYKLQKQVDFLETHPDFGCCCTRYRYYYQNRNEFSELDHFGDIFVDGQEGVEINHDNYFEIGKLPQILTTMHRRELIPPDAYYYKLKNRQDDALFYCMTLYGKIWLMNEVTGVYRKHDNSATWNVNQGGAIAQAKMLHDIWMDCWQYDKSDVLRETVLWSIQQLCTSTIRYSKMWDSNTVKQCIEEHRSIATKTERCGFYKAMLRALIVRLIKRPYKKR